MPATPSVRLTAPPAPEPLPELDEQQRAAVERVLAGESFAVLGAPGTGKTTTALAAVLEAVAAGVPADRVVMLSPRRRSAGVLRERLAGLLGQVTRGPLVRTPSSLAFSIVRTSAVVAGEPLPMLISGAEQDSLLRELIEGRLAGEDERLRLVPPPEIPVEALGLRAFRDELRDLVMRAAERDVWPEDLARLGDEHDCPEWRFAATLYQEYLDVVTIRWATPDAGERLDPARLVTQAAATLEGWPADVASPEWDLVVVDDAQEATGSVARLAAVLADRGAQVVALGDPDVAVQTHRGADPTAFLDRFGIQPRAVKAPGARKPGDAPTVLRTGWRQGPALHEVTARVARLVRGAGSHRHQEVRPRSDREREVVDAAIVGSAAEEIALVARTLREAHLLDGVPWHQMAVVARSGARVAALRSGLTRLGVPVDVPGAELPVGSEPAVRPFLLALRCVTTASAPAPEGGREDDAPEATDASQDGFAASDEGRPEALVPGWPGLDEETAAALLTSVVGGLDALGLRRLRKALREAEIAAGGHRASGALLVEAVTAPGVAATLPGHLVAEARGLRVVARVLAAGRKAANEPGATAATTLWAMWAATGLAESWREAALAGGALGARADRDLDAMLALFKAAERHAERMPEVGPGEFLEHLAAQDLTEDTLAARSTGSDAVTLCTAASAAGGQWELVVVTGVQDGTWPDLRIRDSLLGAQSFVDAVSGRLVAGQHDPREARRAVLDDELRAFTLAVSRAGSRLLVTAVQDEDERPSAFLDLVVAPPAADPAAGEEPVDPRRRAPQLPLDLRGLVAQLRQDVVAAELEPGRPDVEARAADAARHLARLAAAGVDGADPTTWAGLAAPSTETELFAEHVTAHLSPSRVEALQSCSLRWALESAGGTASGSFASHLGSLVHAIAEKLPRGTREEMHAELDALWPNLDLPDGWLGQRERARAEKMVDRLATYVAAHPDVVATEVDVDLELDTPAGPVRVRGRVDRVERDSQGRLRIVDIKTGTTIPTAADAKVNPQLGLYQLAVERGALVLPHADGPADRPDQDAVADPAREDVAHDAGTAGARRSGGGALVFVSDGARGAKERHQGPLAETEDPAWVEALVADARAAVTGPTLDAVAGSWCRVCPVRTSCPIGADGAQVTA